MAHPWHPLCPSCQTYHPPQTSCRHAMPPKCTLCGYAHAVNEKCVGKPFPAPTTTKELAILSIQQIATTAIQQIEEITNE